MERCPEPTFSAPEEGRLYDAVMALPGKYRLPLYLYYYEGYGAAEVGELLGVKTSTIQTRLARGGGEAQKTAGGGMNDET